MKITKERLKQIINEELEFHTQEQENNKLLESVARDENLTEDQLNEIAPAILALGRLLGPQIAKLAAKHGPKIIDSLVDMAKEKGKDAVIKKVKELTKTEPQAV